MWAITTTIAVIIVLIKKWLSERCATHEQPMARESPDVQQQQHPNPVYSPGQLSIVPLMVMHSPPSSNSALSSITSTPEMEEMEEEPVGHRTRRLCVKKAQLVQNERSVVLIPCIYAFVKCFCN